MRILQAIKEVYIWEDLMPSLDSRKKREETMVFQGLKQDNMKI